MKNSRPKVAYLLNLFPKLSETFVLNEVANLQEAGLRILPISLERSSKIESRRHGSAARLMVSPIYAVDGFPLAHVWALLDWLVHRPFKLARLIAANNRLPAPRGQSRLARLLIALRTGTVVGRNGIQHLHAHWSYPADVAYLLAPLLGVSVSLTAHAHDIYEDTPLYDAQGLPYERRVRQARFVVACTATNAEHVRSLVPPELQNRIHLVYHGLDVTQFAPVPLKTNAVPPLIVTVGRQVWCKGFDVVVKAARILVERGHEFRVAIVGTAGPETKRLQELINELALVRHVEIVGSRTQEELSALYQHATAFVNASWPEGEYGVANVIVEALSSGLPVVATDRPHVREYLEHGVSGLLVRPGDVQQLAENLERVLMDGVLRAELGNAGRAVAERIFDIRDATGQLLELFRTEAGVTP
jgi:glycosyltransferase involved in cell wall biosynthesis